MYVCVYIHIYIYIYTYIYIYIYVYIHIINLYHDPFFDAPTPACDGARDVAERSKGGPTESSSSCLMRDAPSMNQIWR